MKEQEVFIQQPFTEKREVGDRPGRFLVEFDEHKDTTDVVTRSAEFMKDCKRVFRKGEKNILWVEAFISGRKLQTVYDIGFDKTGYPMGAFAFYIYQDFLHSQTGELKNELKPELIDKMKAQDFSERMMQEMMRGTLANPGANKDFLLAEILAADGLTEEGYDVKVVFEDTGYGNILNALIPAGLKDATKLQELVRVQRRREDEIISHWERLFVPATTESPINMYARMGTFHSGMVERIGDRFDTVSICNRRAINNYFKDAFFPAINGEIVSQEELDIARSKDFEVLLGRHRQDSLWI